MDVTSSILSLNAAAAAAGLRSGYVRALLVGGNFAWFASPARRKPASLIDAWRLRAVRVMRDAGLTEAEAIHVLDIELSWRVGALFAPGLPVPLSVLRTRLTGARVHVVPDEAGGTPDVYTTSTGLPAACDAEYAVTLNLSSILEAVVTALQ